MATFNSLISGANKSLASTVIWRKVGNSHYEAEISSNKVEINKYTYSIRINGGEWKRQFKCSLTDLKAKAIRLTSGSTT